VVTVSIIEIKNRARILPTQLTYNFPLILKMHSGYFLKWN